MEANKDSAEVLIANVIKFIFDRKKVIIYIVSSFAILSVFYALFSQQIFLSTVTMIEAENNTAGIDSTRSLGGLGTIASLTGIGISGQDSRISRAIAIAESRTFIEDFIDEQDLLLVLFKDEWDSERKQWKDKSFDLHDGYLAFKETYSISHDIKKNVYSLSVEWTNPQLAAYWANDLVDRINSRSREMAIEQSNKNMEYLEKELTKATKVETQSMLYKLIEEQSKNKMFANVQEQYIFQIIDSAVTPKQRIKPQRKKIVIAGSFIGLIFSFIWIFITDYIAVLRKLISNRN